MSSRSSGPTLLLSARVWVGVIAGVALLYLAASGTDLRQLSRTLMAVRPSLLALALVTSLLTPVAKAARWRWLFYPQRPAIGLLALTDLIMIGQGINFIVPGRWGDLVRAYLAGEEAGISKSYSLGTIAAEKLLDLVVLAFLVIGLIPLVALPHWLAVQVKPIVLTSTMMMAAAVLLVGGRRLWLSVADRLLVLLPKAPATRWRARLNAGLDGLTALQRPAAAGAIWGWTAGCWFIAALTNLLLLAAFDLPPSPVVAFFLLAVLQGGVAVPSIPGKVGIFQYLCVLALSVFHVPTTTAFGYSLVLYLMVIGTISTWAAIALWRRSWNLRHLAEAARGPS
jgi:uncharacterized protein (TIRG00374 family)